MILLVLMVVLVGLVSTVSAKIIDNTTTMQEAIKAHNPNDFEMEVKVIKAGKSGNTILVDPLHIASD